MTCEVDGKIYRDFEYFESGFYGCAECVCLKGKVECDIFKCQQFSDSREELFINEIDPQNESSHNKLPPGDAIDDFKRFTDSLYKRSAAQVRNLTDYTDFRDQIIQYLAKKDYESKKGTNSTGSPCNDQIALNYNRFVNISAFLASTDYVVKSLADQRFTGITDKLNKSVIHSSDSTVENKSPVRQEAQTIAYSITTTKFMSVTITKTHEFSSSASIGIKWFSLSADYKFTKTTSETRNKTETMKVDAPSQKVTLDPHTKMNVTYNFYQYDAVYSYFLDFEIDPKSTFTQPDYRYMYYGDANCCSPCLLFKTANVLTSPVDAFLKQNKDALQSVKYKNDSVVQIVEKNGKFILKNIPATETVRNFGVDVVFGPAEPIL